MRCGENPPEPPVAGEIHTSSKKVANNKTKEEEKSFYNEFIIINYVLRNDFFFFFFRIIQKKLTFFWKECFCSSKIFQKVILYISVIVVGVTVCVKL